MRSHDMSTSKARRIFVVVVGGLLILTGTATGIGGAIGLWWLRTHFDPRAMEEDETAWQVASVPLPDGGEAMLLRRRDHPIFEHYERRLRLFRAGVPGLELPLYDVGAAGVVDVSWWPSQKGPHLLLEDASLALAIDLDRGVVRQVTPQGDGALLVDVGGGGSMVMQAAEGPAGTVSVVRSTAIDVARWPPPSRVPLGALDGAWELALP